jgi:hypothetical protein
MPPARALVGARGGAVPPPEVARYLLELPLRRAALARGDASGDGVDLLEESRHAIFPPM